MSAATTPMISLPDSLSITCMADGKPCAGLMVSVTLKMNRKNDHVLLEGPSDSTGLITVTRDTLKTEVDNALRLFPMDYESLQAFAGELIVAPLDCRDIDAAIHAFELYDGVSPYPPGYKDKLESAWRHLYHLAPRRLEVAVTVVPESTSFHIQSRSILPSLPLHHVS